jgi:alkylhydroperoxidase/carboxymuconolactone decarboxylase family protein YurZ
MNKTGKENDEILNGILTTRGFVESFHKILAKNDIDELELLTQMWEHNFLNNILTKKEVALIRLSVVAALHNSVAISHSIDQALDTEASIEEIISCLEISSYFSGILVLVDSMRILEEKLNRST